MVISGLSSDPDRTKPGFHDRALASFMTGVELTKGKIQVGISVDQVAAQALGKETQFASLELATENNNGGSAHVGPVFKTRRRPLPFEYNPRLVFERLFGEGGRSTLSLRPRARRPTGAPGRGDRAHCGFETAARRRATAASWTSISSPFATSSAGSRWPCGNSPTDLPEDDPARRSPGFLGRST